jgi:hypothetical protein
MRATKGIYMTSKRFIAGAAALACVFSLTVVPAQAAAATDYRFELFGKPRLSAAKDIVQVRLVRVADGRSVPDAVISESKADMGPADMASMTAPVKALPARDGVYSFEVDPGMAGTWALHLAAKVQGEPDTVRGTVNADLVK